MKKLTQMQRSILGKLVDGRYHYALDLSCSRSVLASLEGSGYVERAQLPSPGRSVTIRITAMGRRALAGAQAA